MRRGRCPCSRASPGRTSTERVFTTQELVGHAGETEHVVAHVRSGAVQLLAAGIHRGGRMERGWVIGYPRFRHVRMRKAEIQHAHFALRRDHHVTGLEVHVKYTARMRVCHRIAEVAQDVARRLARQLAGPDASDQIAQQLALEQLHRDEICVAVPIEIEDVDDAGMGQGLRLVRLAAQYLQRIRTTCQLLAQHLDGHVPLLWRQALPVAVQRAVHSAHSAAAELSLEHVAVTQNGPRAHGGRRGDPGAFVGMWQRRAEGQYSGARGMVGQLCRQRSGQVAVPLSHCAGVDPQEVNVHVAGAT